MTIPNDLEVNCISVNNSLIFHLSKSDDKKEKEKEEIRMKVIYFNLISYKHVEWKNQNQSKILVYSFAQKKASLFSFRNSKNSRLYHVNYGVLTLVSWWNLARHFLAFVYLSLHSLPKSNTSSARPRERVVVAATNKTIKLDCTRIKTSLSL